MAKEFQRGIWHQVKERRRIYFYGPGDFLDLTDVTAIKISKSGTHYVTCKDVKTLANVRHVIVAPGWRFIGLDIEDWKCSARSSGKGRPSKSI